MDIMAVTDTIWGVLVGLGTSPVIFIFIFPRAFVLTLALILALLIFIILVPSACPDCSDLRLILL